MAVRPTIAQLREENERLRHDLALVGRSIKMEAERRGWCGDHERVIDKLNAKLLVPMPVDRYITSASWDLGVTLSVTGFPVRAWLRGHLPTHQRVAERVTTAFTSQKGFELGEDIKRRLDPPPELYLAMSAEPIDIEQ